MTYQGYPCIFWKDLLQNYGLAHRRAARCRVGGNGKNQFAFGACEGKKIGGGRGRTFQILGEQTKPQCRHSRAATVKIGVRRRVYIIVVKTRIRAVWKGYTVTTGNGY